MEKRSTCIIPKPEKTSEIHYKGKETQIWLGEIEGGLKVILVEIFFKTVIIITILDFI